MFLVNTINKFNIAIAVKERITILDLECLSEIKPHNNDPNASPKWNIEEQKAIAMLETSK